MKKILVLTAVVLFLVAHGAVAAMTIYQPLDLAFRTADHREIRHEEFFRSGASLGAFSRPRNAGHHTPD